MNIILLIVIFYFYCVRNYLQYFQYKDYPPFNVKIIIVNYKQIIDILNKIIN